MGFGDFQIIRPDLLGVVATGWERCDKGRSKAKILSYEQINFPNCFAVSKDLLTFAALTMIYSLKL